MIIEPHPQVRIVLSGTELNLGEFLSASASADALIGEVRDFIREWFANAATVQLQSSGSTGVPKLWHAPKEKLWASAGMTNETLHLGVGTKALMCLSPKFIAGKMMIIRALKGGWKLYIGNQHGNALSAVQGAIDFAAMVPLQVEHSFDDLNRVNKLLIGGASISSGLEMRLSEISTLCYQSYGMTETYSHVALRLLNSGNPFYKALSGVRFSTDSRGCLVIAAPMLLEELLITNDIVELHSSEEFEWKGRADLVINTGGFKVQPEEVESALSSIIETPFVVSSKPDEKFGNSVVLISERSLTQTELNRIEQADLHKYQRPKVYLVWTDIPKTQNGKWNRKAIQDRLSIEG